MRMIEQGAAGVRQVRAGEIAMYPLFYWTGLATFLAWTVLSVYSAVHGF